MRASSFRLSPGKPLALIALAAGLLLAGCKDAPSSGSTTAGAAKPAAASSAVSTDEIAAKAQGFSVGATMAARVVYVFFDPQCPHCAALWMAAKPLKSQARFVWIPVSLLNANSAPQGAVILAAPDPAATMDQHEAQLKAQGGIATASAQPDRIEAVKANTALFNQYGFASVPTVVSRDPASGAIVTREGSMPTAGLAQLLGLQVPAGSGS